MPAPEQRPKLAPAFLIAVGLVIVVLAGGLRAVTTVTSKTTERGTGEQPKISITETPLVSDAMFVAAVALGAGLLLAGSFYERISKITLPGGAAVEFARYQAAAAEAVARTELPAEAPASARIAAKTAAATNLAIARTIERGYTAAQPAGSISISKSMTKHSQADDREFWDQIAAVALSDALEESGALETTLTSRDAKD